MVDSYADPTNVTPSCLPACLPAFSLASVVLFYGLASSRPCFLAAFASLFRCFAASPRSLQVRALASDPKYAKLHELLLIFSSGGLEQYEAFYASNASFVASLGVDHNASLRTIRLLSLCSLAAAKGPVIPYAEVAAAIKVS